MILRLVNAGHEDVGFSLLSTMALPQSQSGEALSVGNFFIRQMVRARRVGHQAYEWCVCRGGGCASEGGDGN